jgi:hypothetical protein
LIISCDLCGRDARNEDAYTIGDETWCERCAENHSATCDVCEERFHEDNVHSIELDNGKDICVCEGCRDNDYTYCEECDTWCNNAEEHTCPKETPERPMNTIEVVCYKNKQEWNITLPEAYVEHLKMAGAIHYCEECQAYHGGRLEPTIFEDVVNEKGHAYNLIAEALRVTFGYPDQPMREAHYKEFIDNPGFEPWIIQGTQTGRTDV